MNALEAEVAAGDFYQKDNEFVTKKLAEVEQAKALLEQVEERWLELEAMTEED